MPHFAKLNKNNVVVAVTVGSDKDEGKEQELTARTGDVYKQTSYNTYGGVHYDPITREPSADQSKAFRKNYASIDFTYDSERDAFIPPKPYGSWVLNDTSCLWEAPTPYPDDGKRYLWSEGSRSWVEAPVVTS